MTKFHQKITMTGSRWGLQGIAEEEEMYFITLKAHYLVEFRPRFQNFLNEMHIAGYFMI